MLVNIKKLLVKAYQLRALSLVPKFARLSKRSSVQMRQLVKELARHIMPPQQTTSFLKTLVLPILGQPPPCLIWPTRSVLVPKLQLVVIGKNVQLAILRAQPTLTPYSQGAAVMDGSIQALPPGIQSQIAGVVLFGYTRNEQDDGRIPNYPVSQTKVYCNSGDVICDGILLPLPAHFTYGSNATSAADFLVSML